MTPKEKATELVDKFSCVGLQIRNEGLSCAKICVDEILKIYETEYIRGGNYWIEVKNEINNI